MLAHPLLEPSGLPVPPLALAAVAVFAVLAAALLPRPTPVAPPPATEVRLGAAAAAGRALGVMLLLGAIVAGRIGRNEVTANIAPALILGVGWPLMVAGSAVLGRVWDRLDPWDTLARAAGPLTADLEPDNAVRDVWWAVPGAVALVWYLGAYRQALLPRSIATALGIYTIVTLAGCLAVGRRQWLGRAETVGILLRWIGLIRRRRLVGWTAPPGAAVVLGVVSGGLLFAMLRYSRLLNPLIFGLPEVPPETVGVAVLVVVGGAVVWAGERACVRAGAPGTAAAAVIPVVAGLAVAAAMVRGQLVLALQLLPALASDPLGRGWDLFGTADLTILPNPLGDALHTGLQVTAVLLGGVAGAVVARHRAVLSTAPPTAARRAVTAAAALVSLLVAAGVLAVTAV